VPIWSDAVIGAIRRHVARTGSPIFTRQEFIAAEGEAMAEETRTRGRTPAQTMTRELQELRDAGRIEFIERGVYRWLEATTVRPGKGVVLMRSPSACQERPEHQYRIPARWSHQASRVVGHWIVYQDGPESGERGYHAVARVEGIAPDPDDEAMLVATIAGGTYLEFGRDVPLVREGQVVEHGLTRDGGFDERLAAQPFRAISDEDFNAIVDLGLVDEDALLPRVDELPLVPGGVGEERAAWAGPVERATVLVNRAVRDRQFRKRVLDVYGSRCALTGMKLINGGGRAETQAAHIKSVEAGGPDAVTNGIALSGTVHWMFDRGLISLSDAGDILLSRAINDRDSVERLIHPDRKARFPARSADRPRAEYLHWHRTTCFHD
jgi:putative restriction endonuclease